MSRIWSKKEVSLIVHDYFKMLSLELEGLRYNKLAHRKKLSLSLDDRFDAIEFKHRNISAVLSKMGLPFIKGYKPLYNYQQLLEDEVVEILEDQKKYWVNKFNHFAKELPIKAIGNLNFKNFLEKGPTKSAYVPSEPIFLPIKTNYLAKEQNNRSLGESGEAIVVEYEKWRLVQAGKGNLADNIEWVSKSKGDGAGFDILSKNINGSDRYIEVKTTKLSKETPIYLSNNEFKFSLRYAKSFFLYRIFNFSHQPRLFIKQGIYDNFCSLIPHIYKGYF